MDVRKRRAIMVGAAILVVACGLRVVAANWWQSRVPAGQRFYFGDSESYWVLAKAISQGGPYEYGRGGARIFRTPGYPAVLSPLFLLRNEPPVLWGRYMGVVLGTLTVAGTMWLASELFDRRAVQLAGLVASFYPGAIGMSVFVLSEAAYCPLLIAQLVFWLKAWRSASRQTLTAFAILAGLAGGAATLVRPSHLLFTPFALSLAIVDGQRRRQLFIGALMFAAFAVAMTSWWIRNYGLTGRFIPTSLQIGASLYDGWNPSATGASDMRFVSDFQAAQRAEDAASSTAPAGTFEERLDDRLKIAALEWAKSNPGRVLQLAVVKFARLWSPLPNAAELQSWPFRLAILLTFTPVIVLMGIGVWRHAGEGWPVGLCLIPAVYLTLLHMVFVSSIRYREPAMYPLIVLAVGAFGVRNSCRSSHGMIDLSRTR